jgi:hypothetical protein
LYVKMLFNRDSSIQKCFRRFCTAFKSEDFRFPVSRPDNMSSRPDAHLSTVPSVLTTCHTVRTLDRPSIIRPDDVDFCPDPSLYREASVPACICPDGSATRPDALQYSIKLPILSKIIYGNTAATVRTRFSLRQESQFKFNRPNVCQHGPDARASDMEIAHLASTVRMPAYHGPDARTTDMEIAC